MWWGHSIPGRGQNIIRELRLGLCQTVSMCTIFQFFILPDVVIPVNVSCKRRSHPFVWCQTCLDFRWSSDGTTFYFCDLQLVDACRWQVAFVSAIGARFLLSRRAFLFLWSSFFIDCSSGQVWSLIPSTGDLVQNGCFTSFRDAHGLWRPYLTVVESHKKRNITPKKAV